MSKEIGDMSDVLELAMKASYYYQQQGSSGSASLMLSKVSDMLQQSDPQSSVKLLKEASNVSEVHFIFFIFGPLTIPNSLICIV